MSSNVMCVACMCVVYVLVCVSVCVHVLMLVHVQNVCAYSISCYSTLRLSVAFQ